MAESEVKKEKKTIKISGWFIIFLFYLIFSLAFGMTKYQENKELKSQLAEKNAEVTALSSAKDNKIINLSSKLDKISELLAEAKGELVAPNVDEKNDLTVSTGVYTGTTDKVSMTLTLSEENIAKLVINPNESGDPVELDGTYAVEADTVKVTTNSDVYSFTLVKEDMLKTTYNEIEVTLSK